MVLHDREGVWGRGEEGTSTATAATATTGTTSTTSSGCGGVRGRPGGISRVQGQGRRHTSAVGGGTTGDRHVNPLHRA